MKDSYTYSELLTLDDAAFAALRKHVLQSIEAREHPGDHRPLTAAEYAKNLSELRDLRGTLSTIKLALIERRRRYSLSLSNCFMECAKEQLEEATFKSILNQAEGRMSEKQRAYFSKKGAGD